MLRYLSLFLVFFVCLCVAETSSADVEIQSLINSVRGLEQAGFVRNGTVHTPAKAAEHLMVKWKNQKAEIQTAEDFIRLCGTGSSTSGRRYLIQYQDGRLEECADFLRARLAKLRAGK